MSEEGASEAFKELQEARKRVVESALAAHRLKLEDTYLKCDEAGLPYPMTYVLNQPLVAPFGVAVSQEAVKDVWDAFVKPEQEKGEPQSVEMRVLMGILRSVYDALPTIEDMKEINKENKSDG